MIFFAKVQKYYLFYAIILLSDDYQRNVVQDTGSRAKLGAKLNDLRLFGEKVCGY